MTDEEKAEKYIKQDGTNGEKVWEKINKEFPNSLIVKTEKSKKRLAELLCEYTKVVFIDGLAEGRKEGYSKGLDTFPNTRRENERLRRTMLNYSECITEHQNTIKRKDEENKELKAQITELEKKINTLKIKNASLQKKNEQQAKQIEKMKCCGNCKWYRVENGGETFCDCVGDCIDFDKWEEL